MTTQGRGDRGRFASKSDDFRQVRSLRLTDSTWEKLGAAASQQSITRADLIEWLAESNTLEQQPTSGITLQRVEEAVAQILNDPQVTRNGKDRGSVRRALEALLSQLSQPCNTR